MILIISHKGDVHCNPVIKNFIKNNDSYFRLNTEALLIDYDFFFKSSNNSIRFKIKNKKNGKILDSSKISAVWERRPEVPISSKNIDEKSREVINQELKEFYIWLRYYFTNKRMIGSSIYDRPNESKINQIRTATSIIKKNSISNIKIPLTLISNNKREIINTFKNKNFLSLKPIGADSIVVDEKYQMPFYSRKINFKQLKAIKKDSINNCPLFLQTYIEKKYELRVTVVGSKFFTSKINSQKLPSGQGKEDWRQGYSIGLLQEKFDTPNYIKKFCIKYLKEMNMSFGCFDFIISRRDICYFLECNPNGQWMWVEEEVGLPISKAISDFLSYRD